jgi:UDP-N-acetylglucosamine 2-epimerase
MKEVLINTGQHYDYNMAGVFFEELSIPKPDYDLGVGSGSHASQTAEMMIRIESVLLQEKPDAVIVYGDTNSTLAGALVSSKLHIPLIHIEAGLRSYNKKMPEEINRVVTDSISDILFTPTLRAIKNLEMENIRENVFYVGDVMYDAVLSHIAVAEKRYRLDDFQLKPKQYVLCTIHRAENTDNEIRLNNIVRSLLSVSKLIVFPAHPRTVKQLKKYSLYEKLKEAKHIRLIEPVTYLEMLILEKNADVIITDSGGVQKEAYFSKVPCLTLRNETEWIETVEIGWNQLVDPAQDSLGALLDSVVSKKEYVEGLYGDGKSSQKIVDIILRMNM